jgi:phenylalanyl-tRNA synthetase beta chain
MKILYPWLKEFVDLTVPPAELGARLSLAGLPLDSLEETTAGPVLDFEVTNNRPDCLGHYGVARETAALFRLPLKPLTPALKESSEKASRAIRVEIECPDLCARYTARIIHGVTVQPSPLWLRERLKAIGQSSINNVVDITNYVMFETGQPMHAFDLSRIAENRIVVRRARPSEKLRTLDGVERVLRKDTCVVADTAGGRAIGGVMGGADSEISFDTRDILLESAWFEPISVRRTAKELGLRTEASFRFERGVDCQMVETASQRAAQMIQDLAGGQVLRGVVDVFPAPDKLTEIQFTRREWLRVMGADVPDAEVEAVLGALGFEPKRSRARSGTGPQDAAWKCKQPSWRRDVKREIDLVEEVARLHGYDKFPARLPAARVPAERLPHAQAEERLRQRLVALGYQEIVSITLVEPELDEIFRRDGVHPALLNNPLAQDASLMRTNGILSMLQALEWNINHGQDNLRLFEIGKRYELRDGDAFETPILNLGATGLARAKSLQDSERPFDFAELRGDLDAIGELSGGWHWQAGGPSWLAAGRAAWVASHQSPNKVVGHAGELARRAMERFKLRQSIFVAELQLLPLLTAMEATLATRRFQSWPRFPTVERDFSLILPDGTTFGAVVDALRALGIAEITQIDPIDLFRGASIGEGRYSLLLRVTFQSAEGTLTEPQLSDFSDRIIGTLETKIGATLRSR